MSQIYSVPKLGSCQPCATAKAKCVPEYGSSRCKRYLVPATSPIPRSKVIAQVTKLIGYFRCSDRNIECVLKEPISRKRRKDTQTQACDENTAFTTPSLSSNNNHISVPNISMQISEVQQGMNYYRKSLSPWFPFVLLPDSRKPAVEFSQEQPFLSIVMAMLGCVRDRDRQRELAVNIRTWLAVHMMQEGQKSLDILQGLLLLTHWYTFQWGLSSQRTLFMHMAMSLIADLGLIRSPLARQRLMTTEEAAGKSKTNAETVAHHTLEQKRALLGCLYLSSSIATTSLSVEAPSYFCTYAESCYQEFGGLELLSDQRISHLCRMQHLTERFIAAKLRLQSYRSDHPSSEPCTSEFLDGFDCVKYWNQLLGQRWASVPDHIKTPILLQQYTYTSLYIHSCSLEPTLFPTETTRLQTLLDCISSLKSLQAALFPLYEEPHTIFDLPLYCFARVNHSISIALQLFSLNYSWIDAAYVENELQLESMFARVEEKVSELIESTPKCEVPAYHLRLKPMAQAIRQGVKTRLDRSVGEQQFDGGGEEGREGSGVEGDLNHDFLKQFLDADDDLWLQRLLAGGE
ncbi:unnamed protein product [Periconia digitata]|uniref:Transcription factor domain-containing protein n=1 Tax=Periconia digitata TaxID=1303443 RepID=A0A9W4UH32_9PLEO|nr:unnamed protein product [Periconia digitata]